MVMTSFLRSLATSKHVSSTLWNTTTIAAGITVVSAVGGASALHFNNENNTTLMEASSASSLRPSSSASSSKGLSSLKRRMTAIGHFSILSETPHNPSIVTFLMTLQATRTSRPWTVDRFCQLWERQEMPTRHDRFHLVVDSEEDGHFTASEEASLVDLYISEALPPLIPRQDLVQRIRQLQTEKWDLAEKLWHIYLVPWVPYGVLGTTSSSDEATNSGESDKGNAEEGKTDGQGLEHNFLEGDEKGEALLVFRGHHALADGASMAAALLDLGDEAPEIRAHIQREVDKRGLGRQVPWYRKLWQTFLFSLWLVLGSIPAIWYQIRLYLHQWLVASPWTWLEEQHDNSTPDRTVSFCTVTSVDQVKWVAQTLVGPKATVNDVFCAAAAGAVAKQLEWHRRRWANMPPGGRQPKNPLDREISHLHMAVPVHLKGGIILPGESVSNSIGAFVVRLPCEQACSSQERLQLVNSELAVVKKRPMAFVSHYVAKFATQILPTSWVGSLFQRANAGASCVVTNVRGPDRKIHLDGSEITSMYGFVPLPPGIPIGVVVGSYKGEVQLTVTAQPWAVPDADLFLQWILEEYMSMVQEASLVEKRAKGK